MKQTRKVTKMADATTTTDVTTEKKDGRKGKRGPITRKPVEIAVVAMVKDASGNPIPEATLEIVHAGKDVAEAFRQFKGNPGSDMVTFTMQPAGKVTAEKAA